MSSADYRYVTTQLYQSGGSYNPVVGEFPFTNVNFTTQLSNVGTFTGEFLASGVDSSININTATMPGQMALYVFKGSQPVWSGIIWTREWDSDTQIVKITAQEMLSYFQHRVISGFSTSTYYQTSIGGVSGANGLVYGNQSTGATIDPILIFQDLFNGATATNHGNIGMSLSGSSSSSGSVARTYYDFELKTVYQAWKDLTTSATFFEFKTYPLVVGGLLTNYLVIGTPGSGICGVTYNAASPYATNLQFPGNITSYNYVEDGSTIANHLFGVGYGANQNRIIAKYYDTSKIGSGGTWPMLDDTVNFVDVVNTALLDAVTQGKLSAVSNPPTTIQVVLPSYVDPVFNLNNSNSYNLGDQVQLTVTDDRFPATGTSPGLQGIYKITAIDVEPGETGPDRVTLTLNLPLSTSLTVG